MERRSPTGIARERETRTRRRYATIARERETRPNDPTPHQSHRCDPRIATRAESRGRLGERRPLGSSPGGARHRPPEAGERRTADRRDDPGGQGTPTSGRHRPPEAGERRTANWRDDPGGQGTPTSGRHRPPEAGEPRTADRRDDPGGQGTPTSGRHRPPAGGRTTYSRPAGSSGRQGTPTSRWGPAPPAGGGRTTYCRLAGCPAPAPPLLLKYAPAVRTIPLFEVRLARRATRGCADQRSAFPCLRVVVPPGDTPRREPSRCLRFVSPAALRAAVPTRGRRSLACASPCLLGIRRDGRSRRLRFVSPAAEPSRCLRFVSPAALRAAVPTRGRRSLACASSCLVGIRRDGSHPAV